MNNRTRLHVTATALGIAALLPLAAHAARSWLLPSSSNVTGNNAWVTVDATSSDDLFNYDHNPMGFDQVKVFAPDGTVAEVGNVVAGKLRNSFDLQIDKPGTWRISMLSENVNANYKVGGDNKRTRGSMESVRKEIPADATDVSVSVTQTRVDAFVTSGKPTTTALQPTGSGLELTASTHPTDLVVGEKASFGLLIDGKPAAGVPVTLIRGGTRYRDDLGEITVVTGKDGKFSVTWPAAGLYWLNANYPPRAPGEQQRGTLDAPSHRSTYTATLEVMAP